MTRRGKALTLAGAALLAGAGILAAGGRLRDPNRLVVRNASGRPLARVELCFGPARGESTLRRLETLGPGECLVLRHGINDLGASLRFDWDGSPRGVEADYIDLWTGEGWVFEVQADGSVKQGYDHHGSRLY